MVNAAVVGLGRWGQRLVGSVSQPASGVIRFTHAVARRPDEAKEFCVRANLRLATFAEVLANPAVQAVVLATPHSQHADQVVQAAKAGKHVFVEKPFTLDLPSARAAAAACADAGVVLALGHNRRFLPAMTEMRRMISAGELGEMLHLEGNFSGNFGLGYTPDIWRATQAESPAGGMTAMGIHIIDAFIHLNGPVESVRCESQRKVLKVDLDDTTFMTARFKNGATGFMSTMVATGRIVRVQVFGTRGWAHLLDHHILDLCDIDGNVVRREFPKVDIERAELEAFARAAMKIEEYPVRVREAIQGIAVMEAAIRSARNGGDREKVAAIP